MAVLGLAALLILFRMGQDSTALLRLTNETISISSLALAAAAYAAAHIFRFARFALLAGNLRLSALLAIYAVSTGASYAIPFKLGELFRIYWIGRSLGGLRRGIIVVWVERIFDAGIIALLYVLIRLLRPGIDVPALSGSLILIPLLIILSVLMLKILPENIHNLVLWVLRSYRGSQATKRLRWIATIRRFSDEAVQMLANQGLSLMMLSLCIWGLEIYSIHLVLGHLGDNQGTLGLFLNKVSSIISPASAPALQTMPALMHLVLLQGLLIGVVASLGSAVSLFWLATRQERKAGTNP